MDDSFEFVPHLQASLATDNKLTIWLRSFTTSPTGIVGMTKCLRQEMGGVRIRCILASPEEKDKVTEQFDSLKKLDLVMNVFKDGKYGSYRLIINSMHKYQAYLTLCTGVFLPQQVIIEQCFLR